MTTVKSNWPNNTNYGGSNWTGRTTRTLPRYNYVCPYIPLWRRVLGYVTANRIG